MENTKTQALRQKIDELIEQDWESVLRLNAFTFSFDILKIVKN